LEHAIAELWQELTELSEKTNLKEGSPRKKAGSGTYLFRVLQVALPVTTVALPGLRLFILGGGGISSEMFGGVDAGAVAVP
jgi:hypothetical protein